MLFVNVYVANKVQQLVLKPYCSCARIL